MKIKYWIIPAILIAAVFLGCKSNSGSLPGEVNFDRDASYALGLNIGSGLREGMTADEIFPNVDQFLKGMKDGILDSKKRFSVEEARMIIETAFENLKEKQNEVAAQEERDFLAENAKKPGIVVTSSGLQYEVITVGTGPNPQAEDAVLVHYEAKFTNGEIFDSSLGRGQPQELALYEVIPGWTEGLQLMSVGSKYIFYIPSAIGYGEQGFTDWNGREIIPPFSTLIFEVELIEIVKN